jgi:hypothetical protein
MRRSLVSRGIALWLIAAIVSLWASACAPASFGCSACRRAGHHSGHDGHPLSGGRGCGGPRPRRTRSPSSRRDLSCDHRPPRAPAPAEFLAISGGENGAFGAGLLVGWTATGTRPTFKGVTGISTGALTAPFAFLGPAYDARLREVYTSINLPEKWIAPAGVYPPVSKPGYSVIPPST